ncbi:ATP-dependent 6-phosphofructokinase [Paenarthrobacter nitroguajacolicus]|uniref:6-phosphofructokinase n=1 Tax=Paenarthrobacter nitroguajacolicus TaxID=211146 RepID=UPI0028603F30|nr:ATP-dependent 6-phosphofructokinase [Paenarthrobacter nitroguajacolicus]MDR6636891.1 6-phosphofructokinase 1 [Paenarthrobacter nitroguajacolicus]
MKRVGILTSGGDCPGLNAVIRGAVLSGEQTHGCEFIGFRDGWRGVLEDDTLPLPRSAVRGISRLGGTILGTSRTNPLSETGGHAVVSAAMGRHRLAGLIAIGGEGTLTAARILSDSGINVIGVPKTIDNDLGATDYTFGFDTAVQTATEAIDRLRTTGESHHRCMIAEVMGRNAGWIALHAGMAAGAHAILIPEHRVPLNQIAAWVSSAHDRGRAPLVVVAEAFVPAGQKAPYSPRGLDTFGRPRLGGIAMLLEQQLQEMTGIETRATVLGHIQRGGEPTAFDRVLATRLGMAATRAAAAGGWGTMVSLRGTRISTVDLGVAVGTVKVVPESRYREARELFG